MLIESSIFVLWKLIHYHDNYTLPTCWTHILQVGCLDYRTQLAEVDNASVLHCNLHNHCIEVLCYL